MVTSDFERQEAPLTPADLAAAWAVLTAFPGAGGLCYFNRGPASGASQPHKHLQACRGNGAGFGWWWLAGRAHTQACRAPPLPTLTTAATPDPFHPKHTRRAPPSHNLTRPPAPARHAHTHANAPVTPTHTQRHPIQPSLHPAPGRAPAAGQ